MTESFVYQAKLVPELLVTRLESSLGFWRDLLGFAVAYDRPEEGLPTCTWPGRRSCWSRLTTMSEPG